MRFIGILGALVSVAAVLAVSGVCSMLMLPFRAVRGLKRA
ncbi:hypothetical protein OPKNFCMD_0011 [Methylobacterium crusticola]|uniref:Uncharacterized protein n=1 Tax=Methylobacterium crusticola TaxID=1697972 RepID=A0ABQ4QR80_9HYPH|nr:hypothetical protein OPKNFCMD_0011 [Methylobacterium crusticola]